MIKKIRLSIFIVVSFLVFINFNTKSDIKPDSLSSATPKALSKNFPKGITLKITGKVKKDYFLKNKDLAKYSRIRIRNREIFRDGKLNGAYIYHGIPVFNILEGIIPFKTDKEVFKRPLDLIIVFKSKGGKESLFSYGEILMSDDNDPIILAFHREEVLPSKNPEKYNKNRDRGTIQGLKLVCPGDYYLDRYLDEVVSIELRTINSSDHILPPVKKGLRCKSDKLVLLYKKKLKEFSLKKGIPIKINNWFRIGHGKGIKGETSVTANGFLLKDLLTKNFGKCSEKDFFLFVGCDGYRTLLSCYEIFNTIKGNSFILIDEIDGKKEEQGYTLGIISDFFVDRDVRGLSHIEKIEL